MKKIFSEKDFDKISERTSCEFKKKAPRHKKKKKNISIWKAGEILNLNAESDILFMAIDSATEKSWWGVEEHVVMCSSSSEGRIISKFSPMDKIDETILIDRLLTQEEKEKSWYHTEYIGWPIFDKKGTYFICVQLLTVIKNANSLKNKKILDENSSLDDLVYEASLFLKNFHIVRQ